MAPAPSLTRRPSFASHRRGESFHSGSTTSATLKGKSSVSRLSPLAKQQAAVIAAANRRTFSRSSSASKITIAIKAEPSRPVTVESEYQEETVAHMHYMETQTMASTELMDAQPELRWFMRPYLVDFIIEIHTIFRLRQETLYLAMNIVDRYVSKRIVYKRHYQLVGCAALLIASKFEDYKDHVPTVQELAKMCCKTYEESAFTQMEGHVLSTIEWTLGFPTPEAWLSMACADQQEDRQTQAVARFLAESTLFHRDFITIAPSVLSDGALLLARHVCGKGPSTLGSSAMASSAATLIDSHFSNNLEGLSAILVQKYSSSLYSAASTIVRDWYNNATAADAITTPRSSSLSSLLPAQCVSPSSDDSSDYEDNFCSSRPTTPCSMTSTPSRCPHDDDDDMPPTPLSLCQEDPMAASLSIGAPAPAPGKENKMAASFGLPGIASRPLPNQKQVISMNAVAAAVASAKIADHESTTPQFAHLHSGRTALGTAQWECNMQA